MRIRPLLSNPVKFQAIQSTNKVKNNNISSNQREISSFASNTVRQNAIGMINFKSQIERVSQIIERDVLAYASDSRELFEQAKADLALVEEKFDNKYSHGLDGLDKKQIRVEKHRPESNNVYRHGITIFEQNSDGSQDTYTIVKGKLTGYTKGLRTDENGVETFEKRFRIFKNGAFEYFEKKSAPKSTLDEVGKSYEEYLASDYKQNLKIRMQGLSFSPDGKLISWNKCIKFIQDKNDQSQIYDYSIMNSNKEGSVPALKTDFRDGKLVAYNICDEGVVLSQFAQSLNKSSKIFLAPL